MSLSEQDRTELRGLGQGQVPAVVEQIVARHVAAALEQAAGAIDADSDEFDAEVRMRPEPDVYSRGHRDGVVDGMETALELIKTQLRDYRAQIHN